MASPARSSHDAPPQAPEPAGAAPHFALLDGIRALAALGVLVTHVSFTTGVNVRHWAGAYFARMDVGVAIFFVLSGFLLYRPFVQRRLAGAAAPDLARFLRRRALRIFPAYWLAAGVIIATSDVGLRGVEGFIRTFGLLHVYDAGFVLGVPVAQAWTLAAEVGFYLLLPFYAAGIRRTAPAGAPRHDVLRTEWIGLGALVVVAWAYRVGTWSLDSDLLGMYTTWFPAWLDHFAIGMGLAVVSAAAAERGRPALPRVATPAGALACWGVAAVAFWAVSTQFGIARANTAYAPRDEFIVHPSYAVVALFLLLPAVFGPERNGPVAAVLRHPVSVALGVVSYGIYLWHEFFIERVRGWAGAPEFGLGGSFVKVLAATVVLSVATAAASWFLLERPILRGRMPARHAKAAP